MSEKDFWRDCADVEIDDQKLYGEPTVGPYRVAARTVIEAEELGQSADETASEYGLPVDRVKSILSYYHARQDELTPSR